MKLHEGKFRLEAGKGSSLKGWFVTGSSSPGQWSWYEACQGSKSVWMKLVVTWFSFG